MVNKEILKKAIEKAENNSYTCPIGMEWFNDEIEFDDLELYGGTWDTYSHFSVRDILFDHDFGKAFWGENEIETNILDKESVSRRDSLYDYKWQSAYEYHLQQMVLEQDPIKYLERFL